MAATGAIKHTAPAVDLRVLRKKCDDDDNDGGANTAAAGREEQRVQVGHVDELVRHR